MSINTMDYVRGVEAENGKLRELVNLMDERDVLLSCMTRCNPHDCRFYGSHICERIATLMDELGIEADE